MPEIPRTLAFAVAGVCSVVAPTTLVLRRWLVGKPLKEVLSPLNNRGGVNVLTDIC